MSRKLSVILIACLGAGFVALLLLLMAGLGNDPRRLDFAMQGQPVPTFSLMSLDGQRFTDADLPRRGFYVINIWGSWCQVCHYEHAYLAELSREMPIVGINWHDTQDQAREFLNRYGNPYTMVLVDSDSSLVIDLGVAGAPETFLVKDSIIIYRHTGEMTSEVWKQQFLPYINGSKP